MSVFEYDGSGRRCHRTDVLDPTLEQVQTAVERLDKFCLPFVWFFAHADVDGGPVPDFEVIGGADDYWMAGRTADGRQRLFHRPDQAGGTVDIWLSDQGGTADDCNVCHDRRAVVKAARHFCDSGEFDPDITWTT